MLTNYLQTRSIDLPSDSSFAVAMRTQQQAERAEQQRIKNLVLNYDLRDDDANDGEFASHYTLRPNKNRSHRLGRVVLNKPRRDSNNSLAPTAQNPFHSSNSSHENVTHGVRLVSPFIPHNPAVKNNENMKGPAPQPLPSTKLLPVHAELSTDHKTKAMEVHSPYSQPRIDKSGSSRNNQRARKLQLSDVDWYANRKPSPPALPPSSNEVASLEDYIVPNNKQRKKEHANRNIVDF